MKIICKIHKYQNIKNTTNDAYSDISQLKMIRMKFRTLNANSRKEKRKNLFNTNTRKEKTLNDLIFSTKAVNLSK